MTKLKATVLSCLTFTAGLWLGQALAEHDARITYESRYAGQKMRLGQVAFLFQTNAVLHALASTGSNDVAQHSAAAQAFGFAHGVILQTIAEYEQLP